MASVTAALVLEDLQNDFCEGGTLAVKHAEQVIHTLNDYVSAAAARGLVVYASRDWHPADSEHFAVHGGPWPVHCVQNTPGAAFHPDLRLPSTSVLVSKGEARSSHGYSSFEGHTADGTPFSSDLRARGIRHLYVGGIATDYCVRHVVLDGLAAGFTVTVLADAIAGVEPEGSARAIAEMRTAGAVFASGPDTLASSPGEMHSAAEHFAHGADIGVRGVGPGRDAAFEQAALALTGVITDPKAVRIVSPVAIACDAPSDDLLLVDWLNALVYEMATRKMLFGAFAVTIAGGHLQATAWGEAVDRARHEPAVEVKGATYTSLRCEQLDDGRWLAQCVVDV